MYQRIIETTPKYPDVLLCITETSGEVEIYACGEINGKTEIISELVTFEGIDSACRYIKDMSVESANKWCLGYEITYDEQ